MSGDYFDRQLQGITAHSERARVLLASGRTYTRREHVLAEAQVEATLALVDAVNGLTEMVEDRFRLIDGALQVEVYRGSA